ncbi:MAG: hypothetical protein M3R70_11480 [Actinomycetota bacterium]|nr:hypothetical protein [Actinomycetota bacterium]
MTETECYARCYGSGDTNVRVVRVPPRHPRDRSRYTGEELRLMFERRLDEREPELAA